MSISINSKNRNSLLITHEAVNFSPSKTTYSFAKGQRFKSLAPVGPPDVIYKLPSTLKTKKITFGIGERFRQRKADQIPPIGTYRTLSSFDMTNRAAMPKTNFWTFGKSATREACSRVYTPGDTSPRAKDAKEMPGPGSYQYKNFSIGQDARKFSFLSRTKNPLEPAAIMRKMDTPAPGSYRPVIEMNSIGKYALSTTPNSRAAQWSPSRNRFIDMTKGKRFIPGPGTYNPSDMDSQNGSYILSTTRNHCAVRFTQPPNNESIRSKTPCQRIATPGPGTYLLPSDFGHLQSQNSPRGSTQASQRRPRMVSRLQLSSMGQGNDMKGLSTFETDRAANKSATMGPRPGGWKHKQHNSTFVYNSNNPNDLKQDSLDQTHQLTTRD